MLIPKALKKLGQESEEAQTWLDSLSAKVHSLREKWQLKLGQPFTERVSCSYVVPCLVQGKDEAILKIGFPHEEARHEIDGLQLLDGQPSVRLLAFDRTANAMLLERCIPGRHLSQISEIEQDQIIVQLLQEIWQVDHSKGPFRPISEMVALWNTETLEDLSSFPDPVLAKQGCKLREELANSSSESVLLATDLHAGNVLSAQRQDWLVIDIKPYVGDPAYDLTQHILNCKQRLSQDPSGLINRLANLAGLDNQRLRDWIFARLASEVKGEEQALALKLIK